MNVRKPVDYSAIFTALDKLMVAELPQMELYLEIGRLVSARSEKGAAVAAAEYLSKAYPDASGFSPRNLRRMRDFYRAYGATPEALTEAMAIGWTQNTAILEGCESQEERMWYIRAVRKFGWTKAELLERLHTGAYQEISLDAAAEMCYTENNTTAEEEFKVVFRTYEVPGYAGGYDFQDIVKIKLYKTDTDNAKTGNIQQKDDSKLICEINGMLVDDEIYARKFSEEIVDRICKRLSLVFIKHNANRHLYQPRVEAMWSKAIFNRFEYAPFVEAKRKALEEADGNNKTIYLEDHIYCQDNVHCIVRTSIPSDEIKIKEWLSKEDDVIEFLMNEYHSALGTENIKSKFFHLFAIIEFCEKEYEKYNGSSRIFSDEEVDAVIAGIEKQIDAKNRQRIISILKNDLMKANDIGRIGKLENILKWMGIEEYKHFGSDKAIDKKLLTNIKNLRNKSFHGTKENAEDVEKKYANAVEILLYIDEKILDFLMKSSYQNKTDGVHLILGKK